MFTDDNNGSLSVPIIPYIEMPLNLTGCNGALVTTCELMPQLADKATKTSNRSIHCIPSSSDCNAMTCNFFSSNGSLTVQLLSCANPPAVEVRTTNGSNIQNSTNFTSTNSSLSVNIGNMSALLNVTVVQHPQQLTLGVEVSLLHGKVMKNKDIVMRLSFTSDNIKEYKFTMYTLFQKEMSM